MIRFSNKPYVILIYAVLALVTLIAFEPVRHNKFVDYDDGAYIDENPHVWAISFKSLIWAFTTTHMGNWHPLTWLSHMLDCELFGRNPPGHHLTSLLLHIANTLLLFWVFTRMTGAIWPSAFVAAAFALHPLHVESVVWAAERKDVLSGLFWMLTMAAYVRYTEQPGISRYLLVILALCLGLMAKPMLVTLPFVLLLIDYWPLQRIRWPGQENDSSSSVILDVQKARKQSPAIKGLIWEEVPLFLIAAVSCVVTIFA